MVEAGESLLESLFSRFLGVAHRPCGPSSLVFFQPLLAQAKVSWRDLHQLVVVNEFKSLFQGQADGRREQNVFVRSCRTDIGQLFGPLGVYHQIIASGMRAKNHSLVDFLPGR